MASSLHPSVTLVANALPLQVSIVDGGKEEDEAVDLLNDRLGLVPPTSAFSVAFGAGARTAVAGLVVAVGAVHPEAGAEHQLSELLALLELVPPPALDWDVNGQDGKWPEADQNDGSYRELVHVELEFVAR